MHSFLLLLTTVISYIIAYNMYGWLFTRYTATFLTMAGLTSPLFTALFGWMLLGESVGWTFFFSMVMVGIGLYLFHSQEIKSKTTHRQTVIGHERNRMILVLLAYLFLSSTCVIGKAALVYAQPIFLIGVRMTLGGILLLAYIYFFDKSQWKFKKEDFWLFVQIAFFHIYLSFILEFWSYKYVTASKAAFMFNLSPFITALFAYLFFRETDDRTKMARSY